MIDNLYVAVDDTAVVEEEVISQDSSDETPIIFGSSLYASGLKREARNKCFGKGLFSCFNLCVNKKPIMEPMLLPMMQYSSGNCCISCL